MPRKPPRVLDFDIQEDGGGLFRKSHGIHRRRVYTDATHGDYIKFNGSNILVGSTVTKKLAPKTLIFFPAPSHVSAVAVTKEED